MGSSKIILSDHFVRFLFPFSLFPLSDNKNNLKLIEPSNFQREFKKIIDRFKSDPDWEFVKGQKAQYFLPYVDEFLNTEAGTSVENGYTFAFQLTNDTKQRLLANKKAKFIHKIKAETIKSVFQKFKSEKCIIQYPLNSIHPVIYLFKTGIGLIVLELEIADRIEIFTDNPKIETLSKQLSLDLLIIFNRSFRKFLFRNKLNKNLVSYFLFPQKSFLVKKDKQYKIAEKDRDFTTGYIPVPVNDLIDFTFKNIGEKDTAWEALYENRMIGYSYVLLSKNNELGAPVYVDYNEIKEEFYWLRNYNVPDYKPNPAELRLEGNPQIYRSFQNIYFGFSLEGGVTLVWNTGVKFLSEQFKPRIKQEYFKLFLLALHQQMLSHRIGIQIGKISQNKSMQKSLKNLREQIFEFTVRSWFPQVSNYRVYNEIYQHWRKTLDVEALFNEVKREIEELDDYLERKHQQHESQLLNFITWFFFPFVFLVGFWGMNIREILEPVHSFKNYNFLFVSGIIVGGYYLLLLLLKLFRIIFK